jgi:hypothetical protein
MVKKEEIISRKARDRLDLNKTFLTICFSVFTFIIALNPDLLKENLFLSIELTLAIPLFLTSLFARSKLAYAEKTKLWENYGFITFVLGYAFLINIIGILLSLFINLNVGMLFFGMNIISPLIYSTLEVIENKSKLKSRIIKDLFFILLLIFGGILPSLKIY